MYQLLYSINRFSIQTLTAQKQLLPFNIFIVFLNSNKFFKI